MVYLRWLKLPFKVQQIHTPHNLFQNRFSDKMT